MGSSRDGGVNRSEGARMLGSRLCLNVGHPLVGDWGEGVVETGGVQMLLGLWRQRGREHGGGTEESWRMTMTAMLRPPNLL